MDNLEWFRQFNLVYPQLILPEKSDAPSRISRRSEISDAPRRNLASPAIPSRTAPAELEIALIAPNPSWQPGLLHHNLSWTHYRRLLRVDPPEARAFYEIEAIQDRWAARELERQINSLLYARLELGRDKKGVRRLANARLT